MQIINNNQWILRNADADFRIRCVTKLIACFIELYLLHVVSQNARFRCNNKMTCKMLELTDRRLWSFLLLDEGSTILPAHIWTSTIENTLITWRLQSTAVLRSVLIKLKLIQINLHRPIFITTKLLYLPMQGHPWRCKNINTELIMSNLTSLIVKTANPVITVNLFFLSI